MYTILSPPVLTLMQFQLPFSILRLFRLYLDLVDLPSGPEVAVFLWDGSFSLPSVSIDLHLHNVTSCPSQQEDPFFIDDLRDFTSMVSISLSVPKAVPSVGFGLLALLSIIVFHSSRPMPYLRKVFLLGT